MPAIERPHDLEIGDTVTFSSSLPQNTLSGRSFRVTEVNSYEFSGVPYAEFTLESSDGSEIYMSIEDEGDGQYLTLSIELDDNTLETLFDVSEYESLFEMARGYTLRTRNTPSALRGWVSDSYELKESEVEAVFKSGDFRKGAAKKPENFEFYLLLSTDGEYAIEIEDYGDDDEEVSVTVYHDFDAIASMTR
ncbi:MAG: hypothetical protein OXT65_06760 [Alphaproteobacteria bacterium]|nr:hypothetical protein [Alphaproteobacteria bacterium]